MPAHDECRDDGLIPTRRRAEEIDDRGLLVHRIEEPAVIRRVRVGAHESVVDDIVPLVDLAMSLALILIPDPSTPSGKTVLMLNRCDICRGLKIPRCGLISGMRSPPNSNPPARSAESNTPPRRVASRSRWLNAAWRSWVSWLAGSIALQPVPDLADSDVTS